MEPFLLLSPFTSLYFHPCLTEILEKKRLKNATLQQIF